VLLEVLVGDGSWEDVLLLGKVLVASEEHVDEGAEGGHREAASGVDSEHRLHQVGNRGREDRPLPVLALKAHQVALVLSLSVWVVAEEELEEDDAERPDVRSEGRVVLASEELGGHVGGSADILVRGLSGVSEAVAEAEVDDLGLLCVPVEEDVIALNVAVGHALLVHVVDRVQQLREDAEGIRLREAAVLGYRLLEGAVGIVFHDDIAELIVIYQLAVVADNAGVLEAVHGLGEGR